MREAVGQTEWRGSATHSPLDDPLQALGGLNISSSPKPDVILQHESTGSLPEYSRLKAEQSPIISARAVALTHSFESLPDPISTPPPTHNDDSRRTLFLGDLDDLITEDILHEICTNYGEVTMVSIKRDRLTGKSLGYGFVQFKDSDTAIKAKALFHRSPPMFNGRSFRINWSHKSSHLVINNLCPSIDRLTLISIFRPFGPLNEEECRIKNSNNRLATGHISFSSSNNADLAKRELDGKPLGVSQSVVRISWGQSEESSSTVHVKFDRGDSRREVSEEAIREVFEQFGTVESINMPRQHDGVWKGYAFVSFPETLRGQEMAVNAVSSPEPLTIAGYPVETNRGRRGVGRGSRNYHRPMRNNNYHQQHGGHRLPQEMIMPPHHQGNLYMPMPPSDQQYYVVVNQQGQPLGPPQRSRPMHSQGQYPGQMQYMPQPMIQQSPNSSLNNLHQSSPPITPHISPHSSLTHLHTGFANAAMYSYNEQLPTGGWSLGPKRPIVPAEEVLIEP